MQFIFEQIDMAGDRNFGYLLGDRKTRDAVIIDPSFRPEFIVRRAEAQELKITKIINTHSHYDHTFGNLIAKRLTGSLIHAWHEAEVEKDVLLKDFEIIQVGSFSLQVLHTPGHSEDHIVLFSPEFNLLITGDHLFVGKVGGTKGDKEANQQYESLQRLLQLLPMETTIWPGHNYGCRPSSTLDLEKKTNPFLMARNFHEFLEVKNYWKSIKIRNGLL